MKNNKKLVVLAGAAALGLVAATGVTSGFAWFAVNSQVNATSLTVQAKSNASYLLINNTAAVANPGVRTVAAATAADDEVYPTAQAATQMTATDNAHTSIAVGDWYTATVNNRDYATPEGNDGVQYTSILPVTYGESGYFVHYDFYLYLEEGSVDLTNQTIQVTATIDHAWVKAGVKPITNPATAPSVLANGGQHSFTGLSLNETPTQAADFLHFEIELFIDGTVANVKSATTLSTLTGDASFQFDIVAAA